MSLVVPRSVMQTWKNNDVPKHWLPSYDSARTKLKKWNHVLMTDSMNDSFVRTYFPKFHRTFTSFRHNIQRADAIRYCYLYVHGGIYMDLDVEVLSEYRIEEEINKAFDQKPNAEVALTRSGNVGSMFTNSFLVSKPRATFWLHCLEEMMRHPRGRWFCYGKHLEVMHSTGPSMVTRVARKYPALVSEVDSKLFQPCSVCELMRPSSKGSCTRPGAVMRILRGSSWNGADSNLYNFVMCNWMPLVITLVSVVVVFFLFALVLR